jgi:predicted O-methyltransferase YrrM
MSNLDFTNPPNHKFPDRDYISPNFQKIYPDSAFPNIAIGDPQNNGWPYFRRQIPHNWYVDRRSPFIGFVSRDEANILYNIALMFRDQPALEIGCWMGWSTCHLALGGVKQLDVIDPILFQDDIRESVVQSLRLAGVMNRVKLVGGSTPQAVHDLAAKREFKWPLIFIDGNHEDPGPLQDAMACEIHAPQDAMIVFHDLAAPAVAMGLDYLRDAGWKTLVYQTMQIMAVAVRGNIAPLIHHPDPKIQWELPEHLRNHPVSK